MRICNNCGAQLEDNYRICPNCGLMVNSYQPQNQQYVNQNNGTPNYAEQYQSVQANRTNSISIAGVIFSIISLLIFPLIFGAIGASCGFSGLAQIKKTGEKGNMFAILAIVIGVFSILFSIYYSITNS